MRRDVDRGHAGLGNLAALDVCGSCLASSRPVSEVLEALRKADGAMVGPGDIIPERVRPRQRARH